MQKAPTGSSLEKQLLIKSFIWPAAFVLLLWLIKLVEEVSGFSLSGYGMAPRNLQRIYGVFTYPLLHKDLGHLAANSVPLLFLGTALYYYYQRISHQVFIQLYLISGLWLWVLGSFGSIHIGASGLVYGFTAFHVTAGLVKRNTRLLAFSLLVMFLYGSMVWGIFPDFFPKRNISWEGHFTGMMAGILLALFHRNQGPPRDQYSWDDEEDEEEKGEETDDEARQNNTSSHLQSNGLT